LAEIEAILILFIAVAALATLANRIGIPYPILLVLGGLVLGFVPGLTRVEFHPEAVLLLFLPPLLYVSALIHFLARFPRQPASDLASGPRPRSGDRLCGRRGSPLGHRALLCRTRQASK
jgi:hypothetical protein